MIRTWRDPWIPRRNDFKPITPKRNCRYNWVADFLEESGAWNVNRLRQYFWDMDVAEILKIRTSPRGEQDFLAWFPERSGSFTVRSAYRLATSDGQAGLGSSSSAPGGHRVTWRRIWHAKLPLKMRILAWKVVAGALATNAYKKHRHIATRDTCPLCGLEKESSFHALITCDHTQLLWNHMRQVWPLPDNQMLKDTGKDWLLNILMNCDDAMRDWTIMLLWRIWSLRNDLTHAKSIPTTAATAYYLQSYMSSLQLARRYTTEDIIKGKMSTFVAAPAKARIHAPVLPWPKPSLGQIALSVDGAFSEADGSAAAGMVLRRSDGSVIFAAYRCIFNYNDALEAELHALMQGMALAIEHGEGPIIVQTDSSEAFMALKGDNLQYSAYVHLVAEI